MMLFIMFFAGDWEIDFGTINDYFLRLIGVIYVDTYDKEDRKNSFEAMKWALNQKIPVLIYPEGRWNLTENLPVMKLYSGVVKAAIECNVLIIPIGMEQKDKHFYINVGKKLDLTGKSLQEAAVRLRDELATLRWQIWEQFPISKRCDIPEGYWDEFWQERLGEWPAGNMELIKGRQFLDKDDRELISVHRDLEKMKCSIW